jgi:DUF1009 family protein
MPERIGLIAGNRKFPLLVAQAARENNISVVAVAIKGETSRRINSLADKTYWLALSDFSLMFELFKREGVKKVVMAGQINPQRLFSQEVVESAEIQNLLSSIRDKRADTIFGAIARKLNEHGLELADSTSLIKENLPGKGTLTRHAPDFMEWEDIYFGLEIAKSIAYLDIGQTVAVKEKAVIAVEALEGTDNLIRRAGLLSRGGAVIIKVSKPKQDMRFDIPVVGLNTVKNLIRAKAKCLAIEAGRTLFIDKERSVRMADSKGMAIVAV